jgi:hypothetical protein
MDLKLMALNGFKTYGPQFGLGRGFLPSFPPLEGLTPEGEVVTLSLCKGEGRKEGNEG